MYVDTKSLKRIIREELDKRTAKRKQLKLEIEKLEDQQINLRHNLEQIDFVESLAHSLHTVVDNRGEQAEPAEIKGKLVRVENREELSRGDLIKRLMDDELRMFRSRHGSKR